MLIHDLAELGELIRQRRGDLDMSQTELAERVGATRQWVSRFEKGKNDIGAHRLLAVIDALDLTLDVRTPRHTPAHVDAQTLLPQATLDALARHSGKRQIGAKPAQSAGLQNLTAHLFDSSGSTGAVSAISQRIAQNAGLPKLANGTPRQIIEPSSRIADTKQPPTFPADDVG